MPQYVVCAFKHNSLAKTLNMLSKAIFKLTKTSCVVGQRTGFVLFAAIPSVYSLFSLLAFTIVNFRKRCYVYMPSFVIEQHR